MTTSGEHFYQATGRRKRAIARVRITLGDAQDTATTTSWDNMGSGRSQHKYGVYRLLHGLRMSLAHPN